MPAQQQWNGGRFAMLVLALLPALCLCADLSNGVLDLEFGARGISSVSHVASGTGFGVTDDDFSISLSDGLEEQAPVTTISSSSLPAPTLVEQNETHVLLRFVATGIQVDALYHLRPAAAFVSKTLTLSSTDDSPPARNISNVVLWDGTVLTPTDKQPPVTVIVNSDHGLKGYAAFQRFGGGAAGAVGAIFTAQNPYLTIVAGAPAVGVNISYTPMKVWNSTRYGNAQLDAGFLGLHELTGHILPQPANQIDEAEQAAMVAVIRAHIAAIPPKETTKIHIGWCGNDYQIDIASPDGRTEYKRIIDRAAQFGVKHLLFAPQNSDVSTKANNTDAWNWEQILWFGMGQQLRMGLWSPGDPIPASLQEMLDYFKLRGVKPVAYVYPILAFLAGTLPGGASPEWIAHGTYYISDPRGNREPLLTGPLRASLANQAFQEWLPKTMLDFAEALGAGGFSFDYTYFEPGLGPQYAQWDGWRTILNRLQTGNGGVGCAGAPCILDNRQQSHAWSAWMWAEGGTYAEPLMSDEQPGSWMFYEADLHTDRLSANRQRTEAWNYRQMEFCPNELNPGFAFHQTDRDISVKQKAICSDGRCTDYSRRRDFDLLGYRYSLLSSVGTAGFHNVLNLLPARDSEEFERFPAADLDFVQRWMQWTDDNMPLMRQTRALGSPAASQLDGTLMLAQDGRHGAAFVFNPTARAINWTLPLVAAFGFDCKASPQLRVRQLGSSERDDDDGVEWSRSVETCGSDLNILVPPTTALALGFDSWSDVAQPDQPELVGARGVVSSIMSGKVQLDNVRGEAGTAANLFIVLPPGTAVSSVSINGAAVKSFEKITFYNESAVRISGRWAGEYFGRAQEIVPSTATSAGAPFSASFKVPQSVLDQLTVRNKTYALDYDLDPDSNNEANVPWLAPGRLLVWAKYNPPLDDDAFNGTGSIDGTPLIVRKAYNTIAPSTSRFIGYWADVTPFIKPGNLQELSLTLPPTPEGIHFENVETILTADLVA